MFLSPRRVKGSLTEGSGRAEWCGQRSYAHRSEGTDREPFQAEQVVYVARRRELGSARHVQCISLEGLP